MSGRAYTIRDIQDYTPETLCLDGPLRRAIGNPEITGSWIIWGGSGNGKTRFALILARELAKHVKVAYDSLEEGLSMSMKEAVEQSGMAEVKRNFILLDKENVATLRERLRRQRSPRVVIIDSLQYTGLTYKDYATLKDEFRNKLFIYISHADGKEPKGNVAKSVRFDANVKIYVQSYVAYPQSRYDGGEPYVVWAARAKELGVI